MSKHIPTYVVDTHALSHYLTNDRRLSAVARTVFEAADRGEALMLLPAIALAELGWMSEKGKVQLNFEKLLTKLSAHRSYTITPMNQEYVEYAFCSLEGLEMHDRLIVSEAKLRNVPLITADAAIHASQFVPIIW